MVSVFNFNKCSFACRFNKKNSSCSSCCVSCTTFISLLILIIVSTFSIQAFGTYAGQKAYLLIAQDLDELNGGRSWYFHRKGETRLDELVRFFTQRIGPMGFETEVITNATAFDLSKALQSPTTGALFWVGHASQNINSEGLSFQGVVVDSLGNDVSQLFRNVHENIRWIGLIGCNAKSIIDEFRSQGSYKNNPVLTIDSPDGLAIASKDLSYSTGQALLTLSTIKKRWPGFICDWEKKLGREHLGIPLEVYRKSPENPENAVSLIIKARNYLVGYLDSSENSNVFWVPSHVDISQLEVIQTSIKVDPPPLDELIISANSVNKKTLTWNVLRRASGERLGATRNVFSIDKDLSNLVSSSKTSSEMLFSIPSNCP